MIKFLAGCVVGALSATFLIGWWLSATPERPDAVAPEESTTSGPVSWTYWG